MTREELNRLILSFVAERHAQMGELESGLYGYYVADIKSGTSLRKYDIDIADFLVPRLSRTDVCIEVGAGIAQLVALLALLGCTSVAVEQDMRRFRAAEALRDRIREFAAETAARMELVCARFPDDFSRTIEPNTVMIFTNVICVKPDEAEFAKLDLEQRMLETASDARAIVIDLVRFTRARSSTELWSALADRIRSFGYGEPTTISSWGDASPANPRSTSAGRLVFFERS